MKILSFIKKWFFPPTFGIMFYLSCAFVWFAALESFERTLTNFQNFAINMLVIFSPAYFAMDEKDGRFTSFHEYIEDQNKWIKKIVTTILAILWLVCIALAFKYFPVNRD
jgi:hypothetical protein